MASNIRSQLEPKNNTVINTNMSSHSSQSTYANVAANSTLPKKEHAIILDSIEGLTNDDYVDGLEKVINVSNIRFISKISGNRVCVYLCSKNLVEEVKNKEIQVKGFKLPIKSLVNNNKRVVISNVHPIIPDEVIINALKEKGIKVLSHVTNIRASLLKPGRAHIQSFRRQFYIKEEEESLLPETLQLNFDNVSYWTFLTTDSTSCFICKQPGHIAKSCPTVNTNSNTSNLEENIPEKASTSSQLESTLSTSTITGIYTTPKRPLSSTNSVVSNDTENNHSNYKTNTHSVDENVIATTNLDKTAPSYNTTSTTKKDSKKKKRKVDTSSQNPKDISATLEDALSPCEAVFQNTSNKLPIDFLQFTEFIKKSYKNVNIYEEAQKISSSVSEIIEMINQAYPYVKTKNVKAKLTRIKNKLILSHNDTVTNTENSDMETDDINTDSETY